MFYFGFWLRNCIQVEKGFEERGKVVVITTKGPMKTKVEGVTFNSNSVF